MNESTQDAARDAAEQTNARPMTALQVRKTALIDEVTARLERQTPRIEAYLAKLQQGDAERFRMAVLEAVANTPALFECSALSIVQASLEAAQLGLEPTGILGGAYLVPYRKKGGGKEAKLIVGYRGYIDLIHRAGSVKSIEARMVYEHDAFDVEFGTQKKIRHVPAHIIGREPGDRRLVYWIAELPNETQFDVLSLDEIEKARKSSKAGDDGPWIAWYDEMAKKTAIRRAVKTLAISVYAARRAVQLEDEAEAEAAPPLAVRGGDVAGATARERAIAALDGEGGENPATQDAQGDEQAPAGETTNESSAGDGAGSGRPVGSEDSDAPLTPEQEEAERARATETDEDLPGG